MLGFGFSSATISALTTQGSTQCCPAARRTFNVQMATGDNHSEANKGLPGLLRGLFRRQPSVDADSTVVAPPSEEPVAPTPNLPLAEAVALASASGVKSVPLSSSAPQATPAQRKPSRPPRDPRRVLVVGASGRLGREVVKALGGASKRYSVVAVVRSLADAPEGCIHTFALDAATQAPLLASEAIRLGCGAVVWCASAGPSGGAKPRDIDYGAVRALSTELGDACMPSIDKSGAQQWLADGNDVIPLVDFATTEGRAAFRPMNDVIMGGRSSGGVRDGVPGEDNGAPAVWTGNIVVSGGGFASVRAPLTQNGFTPGVDLSSCDGIAVTCRGDGKRYKVNLKNNQEREFVFQAQFESSGSGDWQTVRIPFTYFIPVKRGKPAYADNDPNGAVYAAELDTTNILSIGLVCSKLEVGGGACPRFREGPFRLDLARVDAYRATPPRFILVSSAAVTRPFWDEKKTSLYSSSANIPIVKLNDKIGNVLGAKLAGEDSLRSSQIPYAVVRPTALVNDMPDHMGIRFMQGDTATGRIAPADVARVIVAALQSEDAAWKTFEISGDPNASWSEEAATDSLRHVSLDSEQILYPFPASTL